MSEPKNGEIERPFDPSKIAAIVKKNWMVLQKDGLRLRMLLMFPLIMILLYGYTAGKIPKNISAALVDYDHSPESLELQKGLYGNNLFSVIRNVGSQDEGKELIETGQIKVLFIIPHGFGEHIREGSQTSVSVLLDESDPTIAQITRGSIGSFVQGISSAMVEKRLDGNARKVENMRSELQGTAQATAIAMNLASEKASLAQTQLESMIRTSAHSTAQNDLTLTDTIQTLANTIGPAIGRNAVVENYNQGEKTAREGGAAYALLGTTDAQEAILKSISVYQGWQSTNKKWAMDLQTAQSTGQGMGQSLKTQTGAFNELYAATQKTQQELKELHSNEQMTVEPIVLTEIHPYGTGRPGLDFLLPSILALIVFQGAIMGMGRAIAGERQSGSLTRVFLTPTSNITIISGTLLFYIIFETIRSSLVVLVATLIFGVTVKGSILSILFLITVYAAGATGLGMILSVLAKTQEQYMSLSMLVSLPSMFLAGVFIPIETMPPVVQGITRVLPLTYAAEGLRGIIIKGFTIAQVIPDILFLLGFATLTVALSVVLFKRELV